MSEESHALNGEVAVLAPKLRIIHRTHEPLGTDPTLKDLARSIGTIEADIHHNFQAVVQELDDVRSTLHAVGRASAEGLATGQRVERVLTELVGLARTLGDRLDTLEGRIVRSELPTEPALPRDEDLASG